jgi:hypothetical protein
LGFFANARLLVKVAGDSLAAYRTYLSRQPGGDFLHGYVLGAPRRVRHCLAAKQRLSGFASRSGLLELSPPDQRK